MVELLEDAIVNQIQVMVLLAVSVWTEVETQSAFFVVGIMSGLLAVEVEVQVLFVVGVV